MQTTYISKVTFIGDSRSGKTSIIKRYQDKKFQKNPHTTIGVDFTIKEINASPPSQPSNIKMQIWDTAGQERFESVVRLYFKSSYAIVIVFDLTNPDSFLHIVNWIKTVRQEYQPETFIVVGNKSDLRTVITKENVDTTLSEITPKFDYTYLETSAKNNINIDKIFDTIIQHINETTQTDPPTLINQLSLKKVNLITEKLISSNHISPFSPSYITHQKHQCCTIS